MSRVIVTILSGIAKSLKVCAPDSQCIHDALSYTEKTSIPFPFKLKEI